MVKASVILFALVACVMAARPVVADPIEVDDEEEYNIGYGVGESGFYEDLGFLGIDLANDATRPPKVQCTLTCDQVMNDGMVGCSLGFQGLRRAGCIGAVTVAAITCRLWCLVQ